MKQDIENKKAIAGFFVPMIKLYFAVGLVAVMMAVFIQQEHSNKISDETIAVINKRLDLVIAKTNLTLTRNELIAFGKKRYEKDYESVLNMIAIADTAIEKKEKDAEKLLKVALKEAAELDKKYLLLLKSKSRK